MARVASSDRKGIVGSPSYRGAFLSREIHERQPNENKDGGINPSEPNDARANRAVEKVARPSKLGFVPDTGGELRGSRALPLFFWSRSSCFATSPPKL
jgi:hypothetical protein